MGHIYQRQGQPGGTHQTTRTPLFTGEGVIETEVGTGREAGTKLPVGQEFCQEPGFPDQVQLVSVAGGKQ